MGVPGVPETPGLGVGSFQGFLLSLFSVTNEVCKRKGWLFSVCLSRVCVSCVCVVLCCVVVCVCMCVCVLSLIHI